jgi:Asp/Glu/hydantoin racemase
MLAATRSRLRARRAILLASLLAAAVASQAAADDRMILLINPNSNADTTKSMTEVAATATDGLAIEGKSNEGVPPLLTTPKDLEDAIPGVVKIGVDASKDASVGAIIIAAFGDPGLAELRAAVETPVFGIREEAFNEAARDGRPFGVATTTPQLADSFRVIAEAMGYQDQYRGTRVTPGDPNELMKSPDQLDAALAEAVRASITDGAQAVIIGGGPLTASALRLQPQFDIPLVIPVIAAAQAAAAKVKAE